MSNAMLSEMDWDEGLAIPVANAENKALEDEVSLNDTEYGNIKITGCCQFVANVYFQMIYCAYVRSFDLTELFVKKGLRLLVL